MMALETYFHIENCSNNGEHTCLTCSTCLPVPVHSEISFHNPDIDNDFPKLDNDVEFTKLESDKQLSNSDNRNDIPEMKNNKELPNLDIHKKVDDKEFSIPVSDKEFIKPDSINAFPKQDDGKENNNFPKLESVISGKHEEVDPKAVSDFDKLHIDTTNNECSEKMELKDRESEMMHYQKSDEFGQFQIASSVEGLEIVIYREKATGDMRFKIVDSLVDILSDLDIDVLARTEGENTIITPRGICRTNVSNDTPTKKRNHNTSKWRSESSCDQTEYKSSPKRVQFRSPRGNSCRPYGSNYGESNMTPHKTGHSRSSESIANVSQHKRSIEKSRKTDSPTKKGPSERSKASRNFAEISNDDGGNWQVQDSGRKLKQNKARTALEYGNQRQRSDPDRYPSWRESTATLRPGLYNNKVQTNKRTEKKITILKKGHEQEQLAELERAQDDEHIPESENNETVAPLEEFYFQPDFGDFKEMKNSVQISKSQNTIVLVHSNSNVALKVDETHRSKSNIECTTGTWVVPGNKTQDKSTKKRKKANRSNKKLRTEIEILQRHIETGQLRSKTSRYKTEGLKEIKLLDLIHEGVFGHKYKARYQNKTVVLTLYKRKEAILLDDLEMGRLPPCNFILSLNDCIAAQDGNLVFLSLYQPLGDLNTLLKRDPLCHVIGEKHAQWVAAGVLLGMDFLHARNIVHGNIKASKVLINSLGYPVLSGYIKVLEGPDIEGLDVYTPAYAAPERMRGKRGSSVDVFCVGCLAYEIVTHKPPFDPDVKTMAKYDVRPTFEPEMFSLAGELFIAACLCKSPHERFDVGFEKENLLKEEWFSSLDWREYRRQTLKSPLLDALQQVENGACLTWEERAVHFDWGRVVDVVCPDMDAIDVPDLDLAALDACLLECFR